MDTNLMINYLIWADELLFKLIKKISNEEFDRELSNTGSIKSKLVHIAEEYFGWYRDAYQIKIGDDWKIIGTKNKDELIEFIKEYHTLWLKFGKSDSNDIHKIDEGETIVNISTNEIFYNLVNHSTYHRGQIILHLRSYGYEVPITDYYWYIRSTNKKISFD